VGCGKTRVAGLRRYRQEPRTPCSGPRPPRGRMFIILEWGRVAPLSASAASPSALHLPLSQRPCRARLWTTSSIRTTSATGTVNSVRRSKNRLGSLGSWRRLARRQHTLTAAAAAAQPFDESGNGGAGSYRQSRQRFSCQHTEVAATQTLNLARSAGHSRKTTLITSPAIAHETVTAAIKLIVLSALPTVGDVTSDPTCNTTMAYGKTCGPAKEDAIAPSVHSI
jgi:hypothetical protein